MHVKQNWPNLEKRPPFLQFSSKLSEFFFWWKISQIVSFLFCSLAYGSMLFLLGCDAWKMEDLFQRPLVPISMIPNFSKKILVKAEIPQLSSKKNLISFDENWRNTSNICNWWAAAAPSPGFIRVKELNISSIRPGFFFFYQRTSARYYFQKRGI